MRMRLNWARPARLAAIAGLLAAAAPALAGQSAERMIGPHADRTFMIGRWTDSGDCGDSVLLEASGRFVATDGGEGEWEMDGDELTVRAASVLTVRIVAVDQDTIEVVSPDGSHGRSIRCETDLSDPNRVVEFI